MKRKRMAQSAEQEFANWLSEKGQRMLNPEMEGYDEEGLQDLDAFPAPDDGEISTPQQIMAEAIEHLQGRQKEVYMLHMREDRSFAEIAEILSISKSAVQIYLERAIRFISGYCEEAIARGRV